MVESIEHRFNNPFRKQIPATKHSSICLNVNFLLTSTSNLWEKTPKFCFGEFGVDVGFLVAVPRSLEVNGAVTVVFINVLLLQFGGYLVS